jgi:hypothetical protein
VRIPLPDSRTDNATAKLQPKMPRLLRSLLFTARKSTHSTSTPMLLAGAIFTSLVLLLSGCSPLIKSEQPTLSSYLPISASESAGQTFLARYDGLQGIAVNLDPQQPGTGELRLTLFDQPLDGEVLRSASLATDRLEDNVYYRFNFEPVGASSREDFYFNLELSGSSSYPVAIAPGYSYPNGSAYQNGMPLDDTQLAFRLIYDTRLAALGLLREVIFWSGLLAAGLVLCVLPGWALLTWLYPRWSALRWPERLGLAAGASLALYPLIYLYTDLVGLHLGAFYAWLPPLLAGVYLTVKAFRRWDRKIDLPAIRSPIPADLAFLALVGLVFASRFWAVRTLLIPMWGDSYHHSLIAQLLVDHRGLFDSWAPYAEMQTFTYHFGFHTLTAGLHYLTGLELPAATLWAGQLVNGLAVLSLYPLATRLGRSPWAGVIAVLLAGLLAPMPMYYANWGRYTQLAGQVILIAAVYLVWDSLKEERNGWWTPILASLTLAGLALTHLRVVIIAALFMAAYWILYFRKDTAVHILQRSLVIALTAGLLFLPWLVHILSGRIIGIFSATLAVPASQTAAGPTFGETVGDLFAYLPALVWLLLPLVIGWGLWRRERGLLLVSLWWWLVWIAGEPTWYGLPGKGAITAFAVLIAAYIPVAVIFGAGVGWGLEAPVGRSGEPLQAAGEYGGDPPVVGKPRRWSRWVNPILGILVVVVGLWGAKERLGDVDIASHALVLSPDLRAIQWIEQNLPPEARLLVNAHLVFYDTATAGTDGGWWLPLLAGRQTTIPPMNYSFEQEPWPGYRDWINGLYVDIQTKGIDHPDVLAELRQRGVTHVYIGQQQGSVSFFGQFNFDLQALASSPDYRPVYQQDRVRIYEVLPE